MLPSRVVPKKTFVVLTLCALVFSTGASITGLLVIGALDTAGATAAAGSGVSALFPSSSRLPMTGLVPGSTLAGLSPSRGVSVASPEIMAPVGWGGSYFVVRGVNLTAFLSLGTPELLSGNWFVGNTTLDVGSTLAARARIALGDGVVLRSLVTGENRSVTVVGIFRSGTAMDDEAVSSLPLAGGLRSVPPGYYSLIRFHVSNLSRFYSDYVKPSQSSPPPSPPVSLPALISLGSLQLVSQPQGATLSTVERNFNLTVQVLEAVAVVVVVAGILSLYYSASWSVDDFGPILRTLDHLGMRRARSFALFIVPAMCFALAAALVGYAVGYFALSSLDSAGLVQVMFHNFVLEFEPDLLVFVAGSILAISLLSGAVAFSFKVRSRDG